MITFPIQYLCSGVIKVPKVMKENGNKVFDRNFKCISTKTCIMG